MSKITSRDRASRDAHSVEDRLARLLDTPLLARIVPQLPPETLHQLIRHHGLDACGELVTSATPAQLATLWDLDLWRPAQPGRDDQFDVDRFGEWLEVLVNTGESIAARTVAALDKDVVIVGLSRYLRVFDPGIFEPVAQSDDEPVDRHESMREGDSSGDPIECEVGGYLVRARRNDAWDAIVALLFALEAEHAHFFHRVMQGCRRQSDSAPEIDGLDDLLTAPKQHLHDAAIERQHRQSQQGYATPAEARAFLQMARQRGRTRSASLNPIVAAYFRETSEAAESSNVTAQPPERMLGAVIELLTEAGMMPERPRALLEAADSEPQAASLARVRRVMEYVRDTNDTAFLARSRELAFLANALLAGCSIQSRPFTPQEASDAVAAICNLGLEYWQAAPGETFPRDSFLIDHDLVTVFEVGWSVLHQDVSLFAAEQLVSAIDTLRCVDDDIQRELVTLRRELVKQRDAGTPWLARGASDVLATLDMTAWAGVLGLLDECPFVAAALMANLERRTSSVSPTAFEFISTAAQIGDVRIFLRTLPDVLSA
jgi:hypothetical protein